MRDEVVTIDDVSHGGFGFRSIRRYQMGSCIKVALPYSRGMADVFVGAVITHRSDTGAGNLFRYGVAGLQ